MSADIIALDPGVTVGVSVFETGNYRTFEITPSKYPHPHETLYDILSEIQPKVLVYEAFQFRQNQTGAVFEGIEYIGVARLYAQLRCIEEVEITPSTGKAFWNDKKLKALKLYKPGHPHANDATRHMLTHRMKTDPVFKEWVLFYLKDVL